MGVQLYYQRLTCACVDASDVQPDGRRPSWSSNHFQHVPDRPTSALPAVGVERSDGHGVTGRSSRQDAEAPSRSCRWRQLCFQSVLMASRWPGAVLTEAGRARQRLRGTGDAQQVRQLFRPDGWQPLLAAILAASLRTSTRRVSSRRFRASSALPTASSPKTTATVIGVISA